jgi:hypothetical protein
MEVQAHSPPPRKPIAHFVGGLLGKGYTAGPLATLAQQAAGGSLGWPRGGYLLGCATVGWTTREMAGPFMNEEAWDGRHRRSEREPRKRLAHWDGSVW